MTTTPSDAPADDTATPPASATPKTSPPSTRGKRWRRRLFVLVIALVILRAVLLASLPSLLDGAAEDQGLRIGYERLDLSFLSLDVELWHLDVTPRDAPDDAPPLMHLEYVRADVAVLSLLLGDLVVRRAEVDGLDLNIEIDEDGQLVGLPSSDAAPDDDEDSDTADTDDDSDADDESVDEPAEPASLRPPLALDALRVQQLRVALLDRSVDPPLETMLRGEVRLSDLGSETRPTRLDVLLSADDLLDTLRVDGSYDAADHDASLDLRVAMRGLHPHALAGHLAPAGVTPSALALDLDLGLRADVTRPDPEVATLAIEAAVTGIELRADGAAALALERIGVSIAALGPDGVHVARVDVGPLRTEATRLADGRLHAAGLLLGGPTAPGPDTAPPPAEESTDGSAGSLRLDELVVSDVQAHWRDEGFAPAVQLDVILDELRITDVDTGDATRPLSIDMRARVPGVLAELGVRGEALPFGDDGHVDLDLALSGLTPSGLDAYLADAGVRSTLTDGRLDVALDAGWSRAPDGSLSATASIGDMVLRDGDTPRVRLGSVDILDVNVPGDGGGPLHVGSISLQGTQLGARKDAAGLLHAAGFVIGDPSVTSTRVAATPLAAAPVDGTTPASATPAAAPADGPSLQLDSLSWTGTTLSWDDASSDPPFAMRVPDLDVQISDVVVDASASFPVAATVVARLAVDELLDELRFTAHVAPDEDAARLGVELHARGLHGAPLQPLLAPAGVECELESAELTLGIDGTLAQSDGLTQLEAQVADVAFRDGEHELFAIDLVRLDDAQFGAQTSIGEVFMTGGRLHARRDADGTLHALGVRIPPASPDAAPPADDAAAAEPATPADTTTAPAPESQPAAETSSGPALVLQRLRLAGFDVHWDDAAVDPPAQLTLHAELELTDLAPGPGATAAHVDLSLDVPGLLEGLGLSGDVVPDPAAFTAELNLGGRVPSYEPVLGYLPPGVQPSGEVVELDGLLTASVLTADDGSLDLTTELSGLALRDGDGHGLGLESFRVRAPRLDAAGGVFEIDTVRLTGLWARAGKDTEGALRVLGLSVAPAEDDVATAEPEAPTIESDEPAVVTADPEPTPNVVASETPPGPAGDAPTVAAPVEPTAFPDLPQFVLADFGLHVSELVLTDARHPDAPPLAVRELLFESDDALVIDADDPEASPPMAFTLTGNAAPILDELELHLTLEPFAVERVLDLDLSARGLRGAALTEVLPDLATTLDASELEDGQIHAALEARLGGRRRHPLEWVPGSGVSLDLVVSDVAVRDGAEGPALVGLRGLRVDAPRIVPELNLVHIRSLEITEPIAHLEQSERGLRIADIVLLAPPAPEVPEEGDDAAEPDAGDEVAVDDGAADETDEPVVAESEPAPNAGPPLDLRLDSLLLGDIDVSVVDHTTTPPTFLPLDELDVSLQGFSTRALVEPLPLRFQVLLGLGDVPDPRSTEEEPRDAFPLASEIALDGRLSLAPHPVGWAKASIDALQLVGFQGAAAGAGVDIGDGSLDARVDLRFAEDGSLDTRNTFVFRDLDLSEPEDGWLSSVLSLPAPLNTVVFLLRDETEAIDIPLNVSLGAEGLALSEITAVATATLGRLIGNAVASSPLRVVGGLGDAALFMGDMVGLGDDEPEDVDEEPPVELTFAAVETRLGADTRAQLDDLARRMTEDEQLVLTLRHGLGQADIAEAAVRASPPPEVCLQLVSRLRARKSMLQAAQGLLADEVRAAHATAQLPASREATRRLVDVERELGLIERALDGVLDVLRPGAESRADRRTREACQSIASLRLDEVRRHLIELAELADSDRIRIVRPRYDDKDLPELGGVSAAIGTRTTP